MSRQRSWALSAHAKVKARKSADRLLKSYNTHCKKGPSLLQRAGAAQALAFLCSRKAETDAGQQYADDLAKLCGETGRLALLRKAQSAPVGEYLVLSQELLSVSAWLRRFAQIELAEVGEGNG